MTIYLLIRYDPEGQYYYSVLGIFSAMENAKDAKTEVDKHYSMFADDIEIIPVELDKLNITGWKD
jgi:hypothetical protein